MKREAVPKPSRKEEVTPPPRVVTMPRGLIARMRLLEASATSRLPLAARESWRGLLNAATLPVPSAHAALPLPAKVKTVPLGRMSRMRLFCVSPTKTFPLPSAATPDGLRNVASLIPTPLAKGVELPLPARVVTVPRGVILRMRLLPESATYTTPAESTARPEGERKLAKVPCPSAQVATPLPANVLVAPAGVSLLMR